MIVTPLTTTRRGLLLHLEVEATGSTGLDTTSYIQCELIRSINRNRLIHHLGVVGPDISIQVATEIWRVGIGPGEIWRHRREYRGGCDEFRQERV